MKPDYTYPLVGDTSYKVEDRVKKDFTDFVDYEAGISIFHNENIENRVESDYLYFKCGYLSKTHKHYDDLSINLMLDGNDIFIDAGKYNYKKSDPIRNYVISPEAHSVPLVEGKSYHPTSPIVNQYNLGISYIRVEKDYKVVRGFNSLYSGCVLDRTVVLTKTGHVFILDNIDSKEEDILLQNFNISEKADINILDNHNAEIIVNDMKYNISSIQNSDVKLDKIEGFYSHNFSEYRQNQHIRFTSISNTRSSLITVHEKEKKISDVKFDSHKILYKYCDKDFKVHL